MHHRDRNRKLLFSAAVDGDGPKPMGAVFPVINQLSIGRFLRPKSAIMGDLDSFAAGSGHSPDLYRILSWTRDEVKPPTVMRKDGMRHRTPAGSNDSLRCATCRVQPVALEIAVRAGDRAEDKPASVRGPARVNHLRAGERG